MSEEVFEAPAYMQSLSELFCKKSRDDLEEKYF